MLPIASLLSSAPYVVVTIGIGIVWNAAWENPRLIREAREGYVLETVVTAQAATIAETERQAAAARAAVESHRKAAEDALRLAADTEAAAEERIRAYEEQRRAAGRACVLSPADVGELRRVALPGSRGGGIGAR